MSIVLGLPKGSLQESTFALMRRAGFSVTCSSRSYVPSIDDSEIKCRLLRPQEIPRYVEMGLLDAGISGFDWIYENGSDVHEVCELCYSKATSNPVRWVIAVPNDSPIQSVKDLEGKRIATEAMGLVKRYLKEQGVHLEAVLDEGGAILPVKLGKLLDINLTGDTVEEVVDNLLTSLFIDTEDKAGLATTLFTALVNLFGKGKLDQTLDLVFALHAHGNDVAPAALRDDVRPGVADMVTELQGSGVSVMMITGDILDTAHAIAVDCGIIETESDVAITAAEFDKMSDDKVKNILRNIKVIARATPNTKLRLVKLAQSVGLCIGMCGDGTNDAPALKRADVGFAMGDGTDVCKESSDIIITDNNFLSIANCILLGRTFVHNIVNFLKFQLPINFTLVILSIVFPIAFWSTTWRQDDRVDSYMGSYIVIIALKLFLLITKDTNSFNFIEYFLFFLCFLQHGPDNNQTKGTENYSGNSEQLHPHIHRHQRIKRGNSDTVSQQLRLQTFPDKNTHYIHHRQYRHLYIVSPKQADNRPGNQYQTGTKHRKRIKNRHTDAKKQCIFFFYKQKTYCTNRSDERHQNTLGFQIRHTCCRQPVRHLTQFPIKRTFSTTPRIAIPVR